MTIRTVFLADGARVIEQRWRRCKLPYFKNISRNAGATIERLNHGASKLLSRVRL